MKITKTHCDINGCKNLVENSQVKMQVIFITNQTDGSSSEKYFDILEIDICNSCYEKILKNGKYLIASGDQGYNTYFLQK